MLDALEGAGLVARKRSGDDRRVVLNSLTDRGRELLAARKAALEPRWRESLAGFTDDQLLTAAAVLDRVADHFDRFNRSDETIGAVHVTDSGNEESPASAEVRSTQTRPLGATDECRVVVKYCDRAGRDPGPRRRPRRP